ncbi:MAG: hypothetical protein ACFNVO_10645, partial [Prevotella sp.]
YNCLYSAKYGAKVIINMKMITCFPKKCNPHVAKCGYKGHHNWVAVCFAWFLFILAVQFWCSFAYCTMQKNAFGCLSVLAESVSWVCGCLYK